jgi:hypothetical protein
MTNLTGSYSGLGNLPVWRMTTSAQGVTVYNIFIGASDREFLVQSSATSSRTEAFMKSLRKNNLSAPSSSSNSSDSSSDSGAAGCNSGGFGLLGLFALPVAGLLRARKGQQTGKGR